jgi:hypothetical protein
LSREVDECNSLALGCFNESIGTGNQLHEGGSRDGDGSVGYEEGPDAAPHAEASETRRPWGAPGGTGGVSVSAEHGGLLGGGGGLDRTHPTHLTHPTDSTRDGEYSTTERAAEGEGEGGGSEWQGEGDGGWSEGEEYRYRR